MIVGDFNFSEINWTTGSSTLRSRLFMEKVNNLFLEQLLDFPTHRSGTISDLVLTDKPNMVIDIDNLGPLRSSDHSMVKIDLLLNPMRAKKKASE